MSFRVWHWPVAASQRFCVGFWPKKIAQLFEGPRSTRRPRTTQVEGSSWPLYLIRPKQNLALDDRDMWKGNLQSQQSQTKSMQAKGPKDPKEMTANPAGSQPQTVMAVAKRPVFGSPQHFINSEHILSHGSDANQICRTLQASAGDGAWSHIFSCQLSHSFGDNAQGRQFAWHVTNRCGQRLNMNHIPCLHENAIHHETMWEKGVTLSSASFWNNWPCLQHLHIPGPFICFFHAQWTEDRSVWRSRMPPKLESSLSSYTKSSPWTKLTPVSPANMGSDREL